MGRSCGKTGVPFTAIQRGSRARDGGTKKITRPLGDLLSRVVPAFADPDRRAVLWFQMMFAIISASDKGFVEQRVMTGAAGLEHIMWQTLVSSSTLTEDQYRSMAAHQLLRKVLAAAKIPVDIDPGLLPVITQFAAEAWLLTRHYLVLLILHSLGYRGLYRDLRKTSGWAADRKNVPWAGQ